MHHELVERRRWISEKRFLHALNYCMLLPGPEATQLATYIGWMMHRTLGGLAAGGPFRPLAPYIGWMMHRTLGGLAAGGLFVLPSLFILIALSYIYMAHGSVPAIAGLLYGIKPAVVAVVLAAAWRIGSRALRHRALWAISVAAFAAIYFFDVPFPWIVLAAALVGAAGGRLM